MSGQAKAEAALLAVTIVWGASFTLVKDALGDASTVAFLALRFLVATAAVAAFSRNALRTGALADPIAWRGAPRAGACLAVAYLCQTAGLRWTTPSKSAFLTALCTVLVPFFGALVYRSVPRRAEMAGVAMAMLGMGMLTLPEDGGGWRLGRGELLTIGGAAAFAGHILTTGHYAGRTVLTAFTLLQLATAALLFLLTLPWLEPVRLAPSARLALAIAVTGILCTAVAFTVQTWAQRHTTPTRAGLIFTMEPVSAAATSYLIAGETPGLAGFAGAALILAGVLAVELKPRDAARHP